MYFQVCPEGTHKEEERAEQSVRLLGTGYNRDTLEGTQQLEINMKEFVVSAWTNDVW